MEESAPSIVVGDAGVTRHCKEVQLYHLDLIAAMGTWPVNDGASRHSGGMVKSVEGVYRNGKVELIEPIAEAEGSRVIVTWVLPAPLVDLRERGINESQAADLRRRLSPFTEDWERPEMNVYDNLPPR